MYSVVANRDPYLVGVALAGASVTDVQLISALQQNNGYDCGVHCVRQLVRLAGHAIRSQGPVVWQHCAESAGLQGSASAGVALQYREHMLQACLGGKLHLDDEAVSTSLPQL